MRGAQARSAEFMQWCISVQRSAVDRLSAKPFKLPVAAAVNPHYRRELKRLN
jgi:hypothetical protein